jgi:hypothetical protein
MSIKVAFASRDRMFDRIAKMLGVKNGVPVKSEELHPIPLSLIQRLMTGYESLKTDFSKQPEFQRDREEPKDQQQPPADKL